MRSGMAGLWALLFAPCAFGQDLAVFDDVLRNGFDGPGYSYGGGTDFAHAGTVHAGTASIAFTGNNFNAIALARPGPPDLTTAQYPTLRFFVHGGTAGGQQLRMFVQRESESSSQMIAMGELDAYIAGGAIAANEWRQVTVPLASFGVTGGFDRIDLQSDVAGAQPVLYVDDVVLLAASAPADPLFADGFEGAAPPGALQFVPASPNQSVPEVSGNVTFTVARVGGSAGAVSTSILVGGTAGVQVDYTVDPAQLQLAWADGDASNRTVTFTVFADATPEPDETVTLQLNAPDGGATLGNPNAAVLTIQGNAPAPQRGTLQFVPSMPDQRAAEGGTATFTVARVGGTDGPVGISILRIGGTATPGADFTSTSTALSWADGDGANKTVTYTLVDDGVDEPDETVMLQLSAPSGGAAIGVPIDATLTIEDPADTLLRHERDVTVAQMTSDRFTWLDATGDPRIAVLAHNDGQVGPTSPDGYQNRGGALREYAFEMPGGAMRTATATTYGNGGFGGFGYVVSHPAFDCGAGDSSPLGYGTPGAFQRLASGRHHAIFRFTQQYPRLCNAAGMFAAGTHGITIDWFFATGRDHPLWAVTFDLSAHDANEYFDDSRAPYGELNIDGVGAAQVSGTAWGDRYKFTSTTAPVTLSSAWSYVGLNSIPYVKLWITSTDATMGIVQTQTIDQHDAGAGRNRFVYDLRDFWNETSAGNPAGPGYAMPDQNYWAYQANSFSVGVGASSNNARLTWGTNYGFLGQQSYESNHTLPAGMNTSNGVGYPKQSYSTFVVLDAHSTGAVEAQVAEMEAVQLTAFTASTGTVRTQGPAGPGREAENVTYAPAGWDHVYGVWTVETNSNAATVNFNVGGGRTLRNPIVNVRNWAGTTLPASVTLNGVPLVRDVDYFPSIVDDANELLITLNRTVAGAGNTLAVAQ